MSRTVVQNVAGVGGADESAEATRKGVGEAANGTVRLKATSRYWAIEAGRLRELLKKEPEIKNALEGGFSRNMRDKLVRSNKFILDSGGVRKPSPPNKPSAA